MYNPESSKNSKMKFSNDSSFNTTDQSNDYHLNNNKKSSTSENETSSVLSDLNSRTNSFLDYASSDGQSSKTMSRALQKAQDYKARVVEFFLNGDPFKSLFRVTIIRNRDFPTFNKLLDHLTDRTKLPIKFVFDSNGKRLTSVDELEHTNIYICSTTNKFYNAQYGSKVLKQNFKAKSNLVDIRPYLRPLSLKHKYNNSRQIFNSTGSDSYNSSSETSLENKSINGLIKNTIKSNNQHSENEDSSLLNDLNGQKSEKSVGGRFIKGKVVTIMNRKLPLKSSRVLLNLRSARTFEHVVKDLGESVSLPMARILLTPFGNEVRSISQLRRSLNEIDTFFVDDLQLETIEDWNSTKSNLKSLKETKSVEKDELIERLSLAAGGSSEELNKRNESITTVNNKERKVMMVTPVFNESLNRQLNNQFDTISIDSFDTLPDHQLQQSSISPSINSLNEPDSSPISPEIHPSFELINGFTAEFKIPVNRKKMRNKQIQVDIRYLSMEERFDMIQSDEQNRDYTIDNAETPSFYVFDDKFADYRQKLFEKTNSNRVSYRTESAIRSEPDLNNNRINTNVNSVVGDRMMNAMSTDALNEHSEINNSSNDNLNNGPVNKPIDNSSRDQNRSSKRRSSDQTPSSQHNNQIQERETRRSSLMTSSNDSNGHTNSTELNKPLSDNQIKENHLDQINNHSSQNNHQSSSNSNQHISHNQPRLASSTNQNNHSNTDFSNAEVSKFYDSQQMQGVKLPGKKMRLKRIFGYNGDVIGSNLILLSTGEICYHVGIFVVLWDPIQNQQRFYFEHTEDVCCMDVDHKNQLIVSVQKEKSQGDNHSLPILKVWNYVNLETLVSFQNFDTTNHANILSVVFSKSSFLLILVLLNNNHIALYYFDWRNNRLIAKTQKLLKNEEVYGVVFHPNSDNHFMSFGKRHLVQWSLEQNELTSKKTFKHVLKGDGSFITCLTFVEDGYLIAADSEGQLTVWTPVADEICEFQISVNETRGHEACISSILAFPKRFIITGDVNGTLKTWTFDNAHLNLLNVATVINSSESFQGDMEDAKLYKIYIGTSSNMILSGSALQATQFMILYEGHSYGIRALTVDPIEKYFYTAGVDHKICKWNKSLLLWCIKCKYQCTSMAVYPGGETLAVGCANGQLVILSTSSSNFITQISLTSSAIGCLAYSPDNLLLAAGTENGYLHILPVFENGSAYDRISAFKCNYPILSLQWSLDCKYILTSINDNDFQEILLSTYVVGASDMHEQISWYDATCFNQMMSGVWDNENLENVVNLCCHCSFDGELVATGDETGVVRIFSYPCIDHKAGFHASKQTSNAVTEVRFLHENNCLVASSIDGNVFVYDLISVN